MACLKELLLRLHVLLAYFQCSVSVDFGWALLVLPTNMNAGAEERRYFGSDSQRIGLSDLESLDTALVKTRVLSSKKEYKTCKKRVKNVPQLRNHHLNYSKMIFILKGYVVVT